MKSLYTQEIIEKIKQDYCAGKTPQELSVTYEIPQRSIIAKLSSLGVYQRQVYRNKSGEIPVKKEQYIFEIAKLLNQDIELLDSLTKANKRVLQLLVDNLKSL